MKKYCLLIVGIFIFIALRFSIFPALELDFFLDLSLAVILFSTMIFGKRNGLFVAIIIGAMDDFFSWIFPPGTYIFISLLLVFWVSYLLDFLFTNRSQYTFFFLSFIGSISFIAWKAFLSIFFPFIGWDIYLFWYSFSVWKIYLSQALFTSFFIFFIFRVGEAMRFISKTSFLK